MASTTRQALLQALSAAEGAYISGQQLAQQLGVSRAAVHKAAAALTAQGYALEAASRRGYRLLGGDPFCAEALGAYPAPVQLYDTLESTNRTAKLLALEGAAHGTLVLAGGQTAGRGRLGRSFASPAGKGVYCSVVLRPPLPAANAQTATIGAAVAVCRAVRTLCGLELAIKWVNDLYYKGKKVCGILTEAGTDLESGQLEWWALG
jgi:BirA family biotin operon repressor/biotin-[acetyl-CoA-carboxylase] ligase